MGFNVIYWPGKNITGCGKVKHAPQAVPAGKLSKYLFSPCLFHVEASSGCDSAGFLLGTLWHAEILVASENVRTPKHYYLQAFVVKHAVYIM